MGAKVSPTDFFWLLCMTDLLLLTASGGRYAAIAALTNIPAILFGVTLYEFFLADSHRGASSSALHFDIMTLMLLVVIPNASREYIMAHKNHGCLHDHTPGTLPQHYNGSSTSEDKQSIKMIETA